MCFYCILLFLRRRAYGTENGKGDAMKEHPTLPIDLKLLVLFYLFFIFCEPQPFLQTFL